MMFIKCFFFFFFLFPFLLFSFISEEHQKSYGGCQGNCPVQRVRVLEIGVENLMKHERFMCYVCPLWASVSPMDLGGDASMFMGGFLLSGPNSH